MQKLKDWKEVKSKYWKIVDEILRKSDIILNVIDARLYNETRNTIIEGKLRGYGKRFIFVLNKSDLVSKNDLFKAVRELDKITITIPVSCRERHGKLRLIKEITRSVKKRPMTIGVVGYPNTGKSSVINYLKGRKAARTSSIAGFTKGIQWINLSKNIRLIDTPGVIPFIEKNESRLAIKSSLTNVKDPEDVACEILNLLKQKNKRAIEERYKIDTNCTSFEILEKIAESKHKLKKGGLLDIESAARMVINDWQKGRIK